jgi:hypothetical protein
MKKSLILKIFLIMIVIITLGIYLFNEYYKRHLLTNQVLHLKENPYSLKIVKCETFGISDFRAEYYILIDKNDIPKLLKGRKYSFTSNPQGYFKSWATSREQPKFEADTCYTSGNTWHDGLVNIFVSKNKSEVYIVYDVQ